jgi:hypothetical protein
LAGPRGNSAILAAHGKAALYRSREEYLTPWQLNPSPAISGIDPVGAESSQILRTKLFKISPV